MIRKIVSYLRDFCMKCLI